MRLSNIHVRMGVFLLPLLALLISGCQEPGTSSNETENGQGKDLWSVMTGPADGVISIVANRHLNYNGAQYKAGGNIRNLTLGSGTLNCGTMTAGNVIIPPSASPFIYDSDIKGGFGTTCTYALTGGPAPFSTTMYVPSEIKMTGPLASTISKSAGATITWNIDPANTDVIVFAYYEISLSRDINPLLPNSRITWNTTTTDGGTFTLTGGSLASFPVGARVRIGIARGNVTTISPGSPACDFTLAGWSAADNIYEIVP